MEPLVNFFYTSPIFEKRIKRQENAFPKIVLGMFSQSKSIRCIVKLKNHCTQVNSLQLAPRVGVTITGNKVGEGEYWCSLSLRIFPPAGYEGTNSFPCLLFLLNRMLQAVRYLHILCQENYITVHTRNWTSPWSCINKKKEQRSKR